MLFNKAFIVVFLLLTGTLISSFYVVRQTGDEVVPKVNKDLSWIKKYTSIYELFNEGQWEKNPKRSFDSSGVHITLGQWGPYHPVNACHYALFCYDEYKKSGTPHFKTAFINQVGFLMNPVNYTCFDEDKIGYHYKFSFHDLKNPFYSSLAQAEVISVLIRYFELTHDPKALPLIVKAKNFMIYPEKKGGCLGITSEGYEWIEEYPNSKQEAHNFSGFYIAVIALGEYAKLFPEDTATYGLYKRLLSNGKVCHQIYDSGSGIYYNRGDKRLCAPSYLKWMTNLMQHMYEFTGDHFFYCQHEIWATYSYGKDYVDVGVKKDYYNWGMPLVKAEGVFKPQTDPVKSANMLPYAISAIYPATPKQALVLYDKNNNTFVNLFLNDSLNDKPYIQMEFNFECEVNKLNLLFLKDSLSEKDIDLKYQTQGSERWKNIKSTKTHLPASQKLAFIFENMKCKRIKIIFNLPVKNKMFRLAEINVFKPDVQTLLPEFFYYTTVPYQCTEDPIKFDCSFQAVDSFNVFVRKAETAAKLNQSVYQIEAVNNKLPIIRSDKKQFYQFLITYRPKSSESVLTNVEIK